MSLTPPPDSSQHAKRKSRRSGGSGLFPAIKTALVDVCHRKKVNAVTILKSYGELGLGRPRKDATRTSMLIGCSTWMDRVDINKRIPDWILPNSCPGSYTVCPPLFSELRRFQKNSSRIWVVEIHPKKVVSSDFRFRTPVS